MPSLTRRRHRQNRTYKKRSKAIGGTIETVERLISETPLSDSIHIINPESNFVVATYWWGKENVNKNLQVPCPEDVKQLARPRVVKELLRKFEIPKWAFFIATEMKKIREERELTAQEKIAVGSVKAVWSRWSKATSEDPEGREIIRRIEEEVFQEQLRTNPSARRGRKFPEMIAEWDEKCRRANVNYVALNTEFPREDYQNAINGKPLFIRKILDAVAPRGVLYIDGDMWVHKYPHIFDIPNVDFMARGWNIDPRTKPQALKKPFYDPYTFETSGGTMYFANTQRARELLDKWSRESAKPEQAGKADDRILSQVFTTHSYIVGTNIINLPVEYLWLTDMYKGFLKESSDPASIEDVYIEHPYCLTGEERAADQGAAANRTPAGYEEEVVDNINYKRQPETFYEYIYFDGNQSMRDGFARYLKYMKEAKNSFTGQPMMNIIDFANKYGAFNDIATRNLERAGTITSETAELPQDATIPQILSVLLSGRDAYVGGRPSNIQPEDEFVGRDASTKKDNIDMYTRFVHVDTASPMFFSSKSTVLRHLLAMCETLADMNKHVRSYMFLSRIRWNLQGRESASEVVAEETEPPSLLKTVNQIWFGGDLPEWRKFMFEANEAVCKANGYNYRLWRNEDRLEKTPDGKSKNFPSTFGYQETAISEGERTGQSRWAQVADLARIELIYMNGGVYIDSLIEISPAFLKAINTAFDAGYEFIGCNEDPCDPPADCVGNAEKMYLTNSFFAATRYNGVLERLLKEETLDAIDFTSEFINRATGPYYLRSGITDVESDKVFLFDSGQVYQFNQQDTPYKKAKPNIFISKEAKPGAIKVKDDMYYSPGGIHILQTTFLTEKQKTEAILQASKVISPTIVKEKGPLATYHSGLGGTWST